MNRLRQLREEIGWTQKYLGSLLNVKNSAISKYETGRAALTEDTIIRLTELFNVSADYLIGLKNYNDRESIKYKSEVTKGNILSNESSNSNNEYQYSKVDLHNLSEDENKVLNYYNRLVDENKEFIKGQMIGLYKEQEKNITFQKSNSIDVLVNSSNDLDIREELESFKNELLNENKKVDQMSISKKKQDKAI